MSNPDEALTAYNECRAAHPELFANPRRAAFQIVFEPDLQRSVGAGVMYRDQYVVLLRDAVRFRDGSVGPYIRSFPSAVNGGAAVLPVLETRVVLIRHFRHATRTWHWEIPRGFSHGSEGAEETARRVINEELGVPVSELAALGTVHPDTGAAYDFAGLYLARLTRLGQTDTYEGIDEIRLVTADEFDTLVRAGEITDSFTLAAALQARVHGLLA